MLKYLAAFVIAFVSINASAQTTVLDTQSQLYCGYYPHGPFVPATLTCQAPTATGSIALSGFYAGSFSAPAYVGYPGPTFSLYDATGNRNCSGAMTGTYAAGQVVATFSGTCTDGSTFSGTTTQQIATVQHYEGGGKAGRRLVTSYLIMSGSTVLQ